MKVYGICKIDEHFKSLCPVSLQADVLFKPNNSVLGGQKLLQVCHTGKYMKQTKQNIVNRATY